MQSNSRHVNKRRAQADVRTGNEAYMGLASTYLNVVIYIKEVNKRRCFVVPSYLILDPSAGITAN